MNNTKKALSPVEFFKSKLANDFQTVASSYDSFKSFKIFSKESEDLKSVEKSDSRRMFFDEITDLIKENVNDAAKDFLKDNFGCDVQCIIDDFQKIAKCVEENKNGEAVATIKKLTKDFKQMACDSIDSFSNYMIDYIKPKDLQTIKDQFEEILTSKGFQCAVDDKTNFNGLIHLTAKKDGNIIVDCLVDNDGVYCNKIPKVFIADNNSGQLLFAIKNDVLEKYVDAIESGVSNADIINDKTIKKVVTSNYMDLQRIHGIDLWDKTLLNKNRGLYELVRSKEWRGYDAAIKTNPNAMNDEDRKLSVKVAGNTMTIATAKTGKQLFIITETNDGKTIKVTAVPFVTVTPQQSFQGVPYIPQPVPIPTQQLQGALVPPTIQPMTPNDIMQSMIINNG